MANFIQTSVNRIKDYIQQKTMVSPVPAPKPVQYKDFSYRANELKRAVLNPLTKASNNLKFAAENPATAGRFLKQKLGDNIAGNYVANAGQNIFSGIGDINKGISRTQEGGTLNRVAGGLQTVRGIGKTAIPFTSGSGALFSGANLLSSGPQIGIGDATRRISKGILTGMSGEPLAQNVQNKNINVAGLEFDPYQTAGSMIGFVKNPVNDKFFKMTEAVIPSSGRIGAWLVKTATRGGIEDIALNLPDMSVDLSPQEKAQWMIKTFGTGALQEIGGRAIFKGLGAINENTLKNPEVQKALTGLYDKLAKQIQVWGRPVRKWDSDLGRSIKAPQIIHDLGIAKTWYDNRGMVDLNAEVGGSKVSTSGKVKMFISKQEKQQLADLGYSLDQIKKMKPQEAVDILSSKSETPKASTDPLIQEARKYKSAEELSWAKGTRAAGIQNAGLKNYNKATRLLENAGELPKEIKMNNVTKDGIKEYYTTKKPPVVGDVFTNAKGERIEITKVGDKEIDYFLKGKKKGIAGKVYFDSQLTDIWNKAQQSDVTSSQSTQTIDFNDKPKVTLDKKGQIKVDQPKVKIPEPDTKIPDVLKDTGTPIRKQQKIRELAQLKEESLSSIKRIDEILANYDLYKKRFSSVMAKTELRSEKKRLLGDVKQIDSEIRNTAPKTTPISKNIPTPEEISVTLDSRINALTEKTAGYSTLAPEGGTKSAGKIATTMRNMAGKVSTQVEKGLTSKYEPVRKAASVLHGFFKELGTSPERYKQNLELIHGFMM